MTFLKKSAAAIFGYVKNSKETRYTCFFKMRGEVYSVWLADSRHRRGIELFQSGFWLTRDLELAVDDLFSENMYWIPPTAIMYIVKEG